jgi:haloalkane dehalogenase
MKEIPWLDKTLYPFKAHYLDVGPGRMHYLDEGEGPPIVMVHGTPTWSFLYRHFVRELSQAHRCLAPDHLGFGLSDKPAGWAYTPKAHAEALTRFIERLELNDIVLMVHDFGGPIGLSYALEHPEKVRALVIMNTWMWSHQGDRRMELGGRLLGGPLGKLVYERFNFSPRVMFKGSFGDKAKLTPEIFRHYLAPLATPQDRYPTWVLARELLGSSAWYGSLWQRRESIADKPALLLWGMKDTAFGDKELGRFEAMFKGSRTVRFEGAGHAVQEEAWQEAVTHVRAFLSELAPPEGDAVPAGAPS